MSSSLKQPIVLRIHKQDALVGVKQFLDAQIVMGRQGDVQLPLEGRGVSVIHCALEEREGQWHLADLGSETGTKKNGEPVLDSAIESGDTIEIGEFKIEFFIGVPKPKAAPATTAAPTPVAAPVVVPVVAPVVAPVKAPVAPPPKVEAPKPAPVAVAPKPAPAPKPIAVAPPPKAAPIVTSTPAASPEEFSRPVQRPTVDIISGNLETTAARPMRAATATKGHKKKKRNRKTFAPPSRFQSVKEFVKPTKGSVVEVMVAWRERIIATYSYSEKRVVTIGSQPSCDIPVPIMGARLRSAPIVKVDQPAVVYILPETTGELVRGQSSQPFSELSRLGRISGMGGVQSITLEQGELLKMDVGDGISLIIRYVGEAPKPLMAPFLDLTTSEVTGVVLSMALVGVLWLYMALYNPKQELLPEEALDEPLRTAVIIVKPTPIPPPPPPEAPEPPKPQPTPPPVIVKSTPSPVKLPVQVKETKAVSVVKKVDNGKSASLAPTNAVVKKPGSVKKGGAIQTTTAKASQMPSKSKDASKAGIFSTFGAGANDRLSGSTSGSGELVGMSANSTGKSGMNENRPGEGLGSTRDTGAGGSGRSLEGIAGGVSTSGRGGGNAGYGTGGLGGKTGVKVIPGGEGEAFSGTIDKEAIRRVIRSNERVIRSCYERELNKTPDLVGKLTVEFDIGEKGAVLRAVVKVNELGNKAVGDCLTARLRTWRFPEPPTNEVVTVAYPFAFAN